MKSGRFRHNPGLGNGRYIRRYGVCGLRISAAAACIAALVASSSSGANQPGQQGSGEVAVSQPPPSVPMDSQLALGLWKSNFGPVKLERDAEGAPEDLHGVWVYDRSGQEVIGYFSGRIDGNVLEFTWDEPASPYNLTGGGYLVFDTAGRSFSGRWWTADRDRGGEWTGWRLQAGNGPPAGPPPVGPPEDGLPPAQDGGSGPAEQAPPIDDTI